MTNTLTRNAPFATSNIGETILRLTLDHGIRCAATLRRTLVTLGYSITEAYNASQAATHEGLVA